MKAIDREEKSQVDAFFRVGDNRLYCNGSKINENPLITRMKIVGDERSA